MPSRWRSFWDHYSGATTTTAAQRPAIGGSLFRNTTITQQPVEGGGLFGGTTTAQQPAAGGGPFGSTTTTQQPAAGALGTSTFGTGQQPQQQQLTAGNFLSSRLTGGLGQQQNDHASQRANITARFEGIYTGWNSAFPQSRFQVPFFLVVSFDWLWY